MQYASLDDYSIIQKIAFAAARPEVRRRKFKRVEAGKLWQRVERSVHRDLRPKAAVERSGLQQRRQRRKRRKRRKHRKRREKCGQTFGMQLFGFLDVSAERVVVAL